MGPAVVVAALLILLAAGVAAAVLVRSRTRVREGLPGEPVPAPARAEPAGTDAPPLDAVATPEVVGGPAVTEVPEPEGPTAAPEVVGVPVGERPRLRDRLGRTRAALSGVWGGLRGRPGVDDDTWDEIEEALILADVGTTVTADVLDDLRTRAKEEGITDGDALLDRLKERLVAALGDADRALDFEAGRTNVWMFVGVNGVGKTTTIAKIARRQVDAGHKVVLAAADTFRAAAAEQLGHWADRVGADIVRGQEGADPGSVVFDAMAAASNRDADLVLVDTAGRLHTKVNLMEELKKLRRIVERTPGALREVLLVIDASTGQNGLTQARVFAEAVDVSGVVLTKLDGTAKGGIVLAIQSELGLPVKWVGVGEGADDLVPFDPEEFVEAIFA